MDWDNTTESAARELLRQGEVCLAGTVTLGIGADQRATTMCGIFGGGSIALLAAAATIIAGSHPYPSLLVAALVTAFLLFLASLQSARAGQPVDFHVSGYEPKLLHSVASNEVWMVRYAVEDIQARIEFNRHALALSAKRTVVGFRLALCALVGGVVAFAIVTSVLAQI